MKLDRIVLREVAMRLKEPFVTPLGAVKERRFVVVEAHCGGHVGYGEVTVLSAPIYNEETPTTAWHALADFLIPLVGELARHTPEEVARAMEPVRRHRMAKAGLEAAVWDVYARLQGRSLASLWGGVRDRVEAGVAVGLQPHIDGLVAAVGRCVEAGYRRVKVKIKPGWDEEPLRALREAFGDRILLMADANGAYTLDDADRLRRLDGLGLLMIEQPLAHDDIVDHARLQRLLETPICLDESIETPDDARKALELGSCRIICIKPGRVGGIIAARRIHDMCRDRGVPVWCGGMLESGIGRAHNIALASLPNFTIPGDLSPSSRYWARDVVSPEIAMDPDGTVPVPRGPGMGVAVREDLLEAWTVRRQAFPLG